MNNKKSKPKFHFRTNVELKSILGKDLINNDNIAVLELIKNSFDAGSPKVDLYFKNIKSKGDEKTDSSSENSSKIVIQDYGDGMDESDIVNKWLNIAYSEKKKITNKILAGAKGIGRLSCDRLGEFLNIYSKKKGKSIVHLEIDWKLFEFEEKEIETRDIEIQDISVEVNSISQKELKKEKYNISRTGTIVEISKLRSKWDEEALKKLRRYLERLLNPNQAFGKKKFSIFVHAPEFSDAVNGEVKNQIFEKLDFTTTVIESFISTDGLKVTTTLKDKGIDVFTIVEENPFNLLKNTKIVIYFLNTYSKIYFAKQTGLRVVQYGSMFLFKNGFRTSPYGDEGDDWLKLEQRKGQGTRRYLGTRDIVGRIEVNDPEGDFKEVSSREGLVENEFFEQLTNRDSGFFFETLKRLEKYVVEGLDWDRVPQHILDKVIANDKEFREKLSSETEEYALVPEEKNKLILDVLKSILRTKPKTTIDLNINADLISSLIIDERDKAKKVIKDFEKYGKSKLDSKTFKVLMNVETKVLKKEKEDAEKRAKKAEKEVKVEKKKNLYLLSTRKTLSDDAEGLIHYIKINTDEINEGILSLISKAKKNKLSDNELLSELENIKFSSDKANKAAKLITKSNFSNDWELQTIDIPEYIEQYLSIYSDIYERNRLKFEVVNAGSPFYEEVSILELSIIFDNLISNSSKWGAKKVLVELSKSDSNTLEILFSDNGDGITKKYLDNPKEIFELGVTESDGSGIGLFTVRNILEKMNGEIKFVGNGLKLKGATFQITIRK